VRQAKGAAAVEVVQRLLPDVVLMDIRMPGIDGLEATRRLERSGAATRVLILTTFGLAEYVYEALRAGASGFLLKDSPAEDFLAAVRIIARGDALLDPAITRSVIAEFASRPHAGPSSGGSSTTSRRGSSRCSGCSRAGSPTRR